MSKQMLEPCPLCDRKPHKTLDKKNDDGMQALIIACPTGHVRVACINHDAAVEEWNTRPQCSAVSAGPVSCAICGARIGEPCGTSPPACGDDPPISVPAPSASVREALELALSAFHEQGIAERVPVTLGRIERVLASLSAPDLADVLPQAAPVTDADLGDLSGHAVNCDWFESYADSRCRCSLRLRQQIATERAMHRAWRKRAEEAETMVRHMLEGLPQSQAGIEND